MARCFFTVAIVALSSWQPAQAQDKPQPVTVRKLTLVEYATVFYPSGNLNIEAYVYSPKGSGPFPAVVYNHGNRGPDKEKDEAPTEYIGNALKEAGYVVLVTERRGWGKSDGQGYADAVGKDDPDKLAQRLNHEADDVLAAVEYVRTLPHVDRKHVGVMGWSLGGQVTLLAAARGHDIQVAVAQAPGALSWAKSPTVQKLLKEAAGKIDVPTALMAAENDATTENVRTLSEILQKRKIPQELIVYPPFAPKGDADGSHPGHYLFGPGGVDIWKADLLKFIGPRLGK
ncbi:MAG TPA: alpha/beta fold hydrolase [Haliangiales bacterium]|nr:alpha/beta fold hydrolase [Haliangiales bacterium]